MIYLFTAMYCEAYPLIKQYHLKKETDITQFQIFSDESQNMRLTITGTGMIAAAAAVAFICTKYPPNENDFLINMGICAGISGQGGLFLCNKITEQTTGKGFYPDILYRHPFLEKQLITVAKPFRKEDLIKSGKTCLYDMEASAIYQSGSYFFGPHQMFFLKIISDHGDFETMTPNQVQCRITVHMDRIIAFYNQLNKIQKTRETAGPFSNHKHETPTIIELPADGMNRAKAQNPERETSAASADSITDLLCRDLHCSKVMEASVRQHIRYCALSGIDYQSVIRNMYQEQKLPCRDKREGKIRFEEFRKRLF